MKKYLVICVLCLLISNLCYAKKYIIFNTEEDFNVFNSAMNVKYGYPNPDVSTMEEWIAYKGDKTAFTYTSCIKSNIDDTVISSIKDIDITVDVADIVVDKESVKDLTDYIPIIEVMEK